MNPKRNDSAEQGPGLSRHDSPGQRSGRGSGSVVDQMRKDQQRNSNTAPAASQDERDADLPASSNQKD